MVLFSICFGDSIVLASVTPLNYQKSNSRLMRVVTVCCPSQVRTKNGSPLPMVSEFMSLLALSNTRMSCSLYVAQQRGLIKERCVSIFQVEQLCGILKL